MVCIFFHFLLAKLVWAGLIFAWCRNCEGPWSNLVFFRCFPITLFLFLPFHDFHHWITNLIFLSLVCLCQPFVTVPRIFFLNLLGTLVEYCQWAKHTLLLEFIAFSLGSRILHYVPMIFNAKFVGFILTQSCHVTLLTCHHLILKWWSQTFITHVGPLKHIYCHVIVLGDRSPQIWWCSSTV